MHDLDQPPCNRWEGTEPPGLLILEIFKVAF